MPFPLAKSESSICPYQDVVLKILQPHLCLLLAPWHCFLTRWYPLLWSAHSCAYLHLPDYCGPNKWTKLTLVDLGWNQAGSKKQLLSLTISLAGTAAKVHMTKALENQSLWSVTTWVKKRKMHLSLLNFFYSISSPFARTYRGIRLGRETGDTVDTSSTSISLKNVHCRVASTRQMPFSNVMIGHYCSTPAVPSYRKALRGVKGTLQTARGKKVFLVIGRKHLQSNSFLVVPNKKLDKATRI